MPAGEASVLFFFGGGIPEVTAKPVKTSDDPVARLWADLENERVTIANYRQPIRQAEAMGEKGFVFLHSRNITDCFQELAVVV